MRLIGWSLQLNRMSGIYKLKLDPYPEMFCCSVTVSMLLLWILLRLTCTHGPHRTQLDSHDSWQPKFKGLYSDFYQQIICRNSLGKWGLGQICQERCHLFCVVHVYFSISWAVWVEGPLRGGLSHPVRLSVRSYWVRMRFSWPQICPVLRMFGGLSMTKSRLWTPLSRSAWVQQSAPVGRQRGNEIQPLILIHLILPLWENSVNRQMYVTTHWTHCIWKLSL